ncbi:hypothetical protein CHS0354_039342 [Potamilus streckersoni]|uniref:Uncharacterized protein n=1 Tax=Potamilus streckersoni TaxID=2493646 RepID=A0AAE0W6I7_9BIVA|nr:hypothetical protein CHS0354_039342 [Potamilus streckersoni]
MWEANEEARTKTDTTIPHQKVAYDLKVHGQSFSHGDLVWLHHTLKKRKRNHLNYRSNGLDNGGLLRESNHKTTQIVHFNQLKPCFLRAESENQHTDRQEEVYDRGDDTEKDEGSTYPITAQRASLMEPRRERRRNSTFGNYFAHNTAGDKKQMDDG